MESKRIRLGFVCSNANPFSSDMLPSLSMRSMECVLLGEKQYVIFTVEKPVRVCDVLKAIEGFNSGAGELALKLEKFQDNEELIVKFEKGQRFMQHPFYTLIQEAKKIPVVEGEPQRIWEWGVDGIPGSVRHKRVAGELTSDLVEDSILPSDPKRSTGPPSKQSDEDAMKVCVVSLSLVCIRCVEPVINRILSQATSSILKKIAQSKTKSKSSSHLGSFGSTHFKGSETGFPMQKGGSTVDVKIFSLVNEVTKSKDETIASKNYTIQLLESMLQNQKKCTCAAVNVTE